jgi:arsenical pump membrane protein
MRVPMTFDTACLAIWIIAGLSTLGVIVRPFRWPEAIWAAAGATLVVGLGLLPLAAAGEAVADGLDVYLFLIGMMLLSETARREGLFDRVAAMAVNRSRHSPQRLFALIYAVGVVVTAFLSNDATAVVLTPAVYTAAKKAKVDPLPYLFICALVANAASFILPVSNPANIVLYGDHTPPLGAWMARFALASILSVAATFFGLRIVMRARLEKRCESNVALPPMSPGSWTALSGIAAAGLVLIGVSALDWHLGLPTFGMGVLTTAIVLIRKRASPWSVLKGVSWSVLPLVAGLFVLVNALTRTGFIAALGALLAQSMKVDPVQTAWGAGGLIAVASNFINNLPAGLIASSTIAATHPPQTVTDALLIGVDLGPNFSVTGSLATILWLTAIRREGASVGFWDFLKVGILTTPMALGAALAARLLITA